MNSTGMKKGLVLVVIMLVLLRKRIDEIDSDDMTSVGYLLEFAVWAIYGLLIG